jgi:hypothetical protein
MPFRYTTTDKLPNQLLQFGDAFSGWELKQAADGRFGGRLVRFLGMGQMPDLLAVLLGMVALVTRPEVAAWCSVVPLLGVARPDPVVRLLIEDPTGSSSRRI